MFSKILLQSVMCSQNFLFINLPSFREGSVSGSDRLKNRKTDPDLYQTIADTQRYRQEFPFISKLILHIKFGFENSIVHSGSCFS
jgi:hypothetical protein